MTITAPKAGAVDAARRADGEPNGSLPAPPPSHVSAAARPAATIALAALTTASALGLLRVFAGKGWMGPVLGTVLVVHLVCWALRRAGARSLIAVPAVGAAIVLMGSWTVLGRYTAYGVPTATTWNRAVTALRGIGDQIASTAPPVHVTTAFALVAVAGAAVAAALGDWAAFRWRSPLLALVPALAAFIFCSTSGGGPGRAAVVGLEVAGVCVFLTVERAAGGEALSWFAGVRAGVGTWAVAAGGIIMAASVVAAMAVSPSLARRDGTGVLGWRSGVGGNGGERIVPNPLVDLRTRLTRLTHQPVFVVDSTVPSYWRLTSLDTFDGVTWTSTGSYGTFGSRLPGAPPGGASVRTVRATFQIQQLDSVWLPAQFDPVAVRGAPHVTYDPRSNSLLTSKSTSDGLEYSVTSYQYLDTLSASALEKAPALPRSSVVTQNLELPASLGNAILTLARQIVSGRSTEYDKAIAIQDFLRSPRFTYSLNPPSDGSGNEALYSFLFDTRTGYCQQFAGSFAVLARAVDLPTRLAVGFAQGQATGTGFQVRDGDYHTWPEVYFGPAFGWVPFEPTPGFSVPGSNGYSDTGGSPTGPAPTPTTTVPATLPGGSGGSPQSIAKQPARTPSTSVASGVAQHRSNGVSAWWLALPALLLVWVSLTAGAPLLARRLRGRRARRAGDEAVVLDVWERVTSDLEWHGIERRAHETDDEFARRADVALRRLGVDVRWAHGGPAALAALARQARFAPTMPDGSGGRAAVAAREVQDRLAAVTSPARRVARLWLPPPGTWRQGADRLRRVAAGLAARPSSRRLGRVAGGAGGRSPRAPG